MSEYAISVSEKNVKILSKIANTTKTEEDLQIAQTFFNEALLVLMEVASRDLLRIVKEFSELSSPNDVSKFTDDWFEEDYFNYRNSGLNRWVNWVDCHS